MSSDAIRTPSVADASHVDDDPWTQAAAAKPLPVHWRSDPRVQPWSPQPGDSAPIYVAGMGGTILSGAAFGACLVLLGLLLSQRRGVNPLEAGMVLVMASAVGGVFALCSAVAVFPLVGLIQKLTGLHRHFGTFVAVAGGWSGLAVSTFLTNGNEHALGIAMMPFCLGALVFGQCGAALGARAARRSFQIAERWGNPAVHAQFSLRQLLGLTAAVAILCAILANLPLSRESHIALANCLTLQAIGTGACLAVAADRRRISAASQRMAGLWDPSEGPLDAAVPRETTGAVGEI